MAALDAAEKAAPVRVLQLELNDLYGVLVKIAGGVADIKAALGAAKVIAEQMRVEHVIHGISSPDREIERFVMAPREVNPLLEQDVVFFPDAKYQQETS